MYLTQELNFGLLFLVTSYIQPVVLPTQAFGLYFQYIFAVGIEHRCGWVSTVVDSCVLHLQRGAFSVSLKHHST